MKWKNNCIIYNYFMNKILWTKNYGRAFCNVILSLSKESLFNIFSQKNLKEMFPHDYIQSDVCIGFKSSTILHWVMFRVRVKNYNLRSWGLYTIYKMHQLSQIIEQKALLFIKKYIFKKHISILRFWNKYLKVIRHVSLAYYLVWVEQINYIIFKNYTF